jgi:CRISPR system Cascade subunit CasE
MVQNEDALYMVRLTASLPGLVALGQRRRLPLHQTDDGYLVHCLLGELFGQLAPRPFAIQTAKARTLTVLAYCRHSQEALRRQADTFADPAVHAACVWNRMAVKPMPTNWPAGIRLGFGVRVCPVVRVGADGPHCRKGAEVDVFLARCGAAQLGDRQVAYCGWFVEQIERRGGARVIDVHVNGFRRGQFVRRTHGVERKAVVRERPDVALTGILEVTDGNTFGILLRGGIGRHRAFGFGMLLLRPAAVRC